MHFRKSLIAEKRKLIGSMYLKNLCFDEIGHRTPYLSEPLSLIFQINKQLQELKNDNTLLTNYLHFIFHPLRHK